MLRQLVNVILIQTRRAMLSGYDAVSSKTRYFGIG